MNVRTQARKAAVATRLLNLRNEHSKKTVLFSFYLALFLLLLLLLVVVVVV